MFISYYLKFPLEFIIFFFYINSGINFNKSIIEFPFHVNSIRQGRLTRCYCIHIHIIPTYILLYPHTCYVLHVSRRHMHQSDVCVWVCVCVCTCIERHWSEDRAVGAVFFQASSIQLQIYYIIANIVTIYNKYSRLDYINKIYRIVSLGLQQHVTVNN